MTVTHIGLSTSDEPWVESRSDADLVVVHLDLQTTVSMRRAQWEALRVQGGEQS